MHCIFVIDPEQHHTMISSRIVLVIKAGFDHSNIAYTVDVIVGSKEVSSNVVTADRQF